MGRRGLLGAALALVALVLSVMFAVVPASFHRADITWQPTSSGDGGAMQLTRASPERMAIETTCDLARTRTDEDPSMLTTGSVELLLERGEVALRAAPDGPVARLDLPSGECTIRAEYTLDPSRLQLSIDDMEDEVRVDPPAIHGLYTTDPPSVERVDILTQETGLAPSWSRWIIGLAAAALVLLALIVVRPTSPRPERARHGWRRLVPRLDPVDGVVTVGVVVLSLVTPALIDDGWVMGRTRELMDRWWFGNLYDTQDAWLPQGFLHELGFSLLQEAGFDLAHLRVVVALLLALTWVVLRRGVLVPALGEQASRWPPAAATFLAFAGAWMITVRAEPVVTFLAVLALAVAISAERCARPGMVFAGLLAAGLAMGTHQTGWVALGPAIAILWSIRATTRHDRTLLPGLVTAVLAAGAAVTLATFAVADVATVLEGGRTFSDATHSSGPLDEMDRYGRVFNQAAGARIFTVLLLLVWCVAGSVGMDARPAPAKRLWVLSALWLGGLLLTSSKWEWHLAVYAVPTACLAALATDDLARRDRGSVLGLAPLLAVVGLAVGAGLRASGSWSARDLSGRTWPELTELLVGESSRKWVYLALVALTVLGLAARRSERWRTAALTALCLTILSPLAASMTWVAADALEPGWSPAGSNLRELVGRSECGVLDGLDIDTDPVPLATVEDTGVRDSQLAPEAFPHVERLWTGPLGGDVPTWGTWASDGKSTADGRTGSFRTPLFRVTDAEAVTIWSSFGSVDFLSATVVFIDVSGNKTTTSIVPNSDPHWGRVRLAVPEDAVTMRVDVEDDNSGYGGWMAVSSPTVTPDRPASSALSGTSGYASPFDGTLYPCLELPDLSKGFWDRVDYLSSEGPAFNSSSLRSLTVTDVACRSDVVCLRRLHYPMAEVEVSRSTS